MSNKQINFEQRIQNLLSLQKRLFQNNLTELDRFFLFLEIQDKITFFQDLINCEKPN